MKYAYRNGFTFGGVSAEVAGRELKRIHRKYNQLTAEIVVAESTSTRETLHEAVDWEDAIGGRKHRQSTARSLIKCVVIVREKDDREPVFVHVKGATIRDNSYEPLVRVLTDDDQFTVAVRELSDGMNATANAVVTVMRLAAKSGDAKRRRLVQVAINKIEAARKAVTEL